MNKIFYFDNNATTPIDPRVLEAMLPYLKDMFGNASSSHQFGLRINKAVEDAREKVAELIQAAASEIIFTSGATESINIALKGYALANQEKGKHIITVQTEHKAVLDTCKYLETIGFEVSYLPVMKSGLLDLNQLSNELRSDSILVCVMAANNEIGVLQPLKEIASITHEAGAVFFSDATQAVGKIKTDVTEMGVDFMAFSAHKFYGAKGAGALFIKDMKRHKTKLETLIHGGGHENGLRSGTLNVPAIIAMGKASEIALDEMQSDQERIFFFRNELEGDLLKIEGSFVNGSQEQRMYNVTNICFPHIEANIFIGKMKNVAVSNGSACTSAIIEPSHVLKAIGLPDNKALASIRFSLGRFNTKEEMIYLVKILKSFIIPNHI